MIETVSCLWQDCGVFVRIVMFVARLWYALGSARELKSVRGENEALFIELYTDQ